MYAFGKYSRKACRAGKVIIRSPIAQGRSISMCFSGSDIFLLWLTVLMMLMMRKNRVIRIRVIVHRRGRGERVRSQRSLR